MKLKNLSVAMILATVPMTGAFAAAMDRSGQSISAFLQPGNYAEAGLMVLDPNVSGKDNNGVNTGDMASSYHSASAALKIQATDNISIGLLFDQPFGAKAQYDTSSPTFSNNGEGTSAEVTTENLTLLVGFQPNANWNFYAGPVWQQAKGEVHLRGSAYSVLGGSGLNQTYDADMKNDDAWGWAAGFAYQIPEIALKTSITYRSKIKHELSAVETFNNSTTPNPMLQAGTVTQGDTIVETPQSVNLDFQTGIAENTVAFANVRWVDWSSFSIRPHAFDQVVRGTTIATNSGKKQGFDLVAYDKDQWSINAGVGRKFSEHWAGNASIGWDSGAGNPVSTLGPTEGYWSVGLGGQYSPAANYFVQAGVKYFWLGDAKAQSGADFGSDKYEANFKSNHAIGYGLKFGYKF